MSGYDTGRLYSAQVLSGNDASRAPDAPAQTEASLFDFVQRFRLGADYVYRDRLRANLLAKQYVLEVMLEHVQLWNVGLAQLMRTEPGEILPLVSAVRGVVRPGGARVAGHVRARMHGGARRTQGCLAPCAATMQAEQCSIVSA
jgi:DNA replication licensing factor MCM5